MITTGKLTNSLWHLYRKCFVVSLHNDGFTFIAHAQKRPEKCKRDTATSATRLWHALLPSPPNKRRVVIVDMRNVLQQNYSSYTTDCYRYACLNVDYLLSNSHCIINGVNHLSHTHLTCSNAKMSITMHN